MTPEVAHAPEGDHGRPEDGGPDEEGRHGRRSGTPKPAVDLGAVDGQLQGDDRGRRPDHPARRSRSTVKEENGAWVVSETAKTPMGDMADTTTLEKGTLVAEEALGLAGPVAIALAFEGNKATGTMTMNGQSKPIDAELGGALFADGAGTHNVIATLPLAEGYTTTFRNFNVQSQKVALKQLKVVGVEEVTVPAGTFKAWKVEESSAEGEPGTTTHLGRHRLAQGREDLGDAAADGRGGADVGVAVDRLGAEDKVQGMSSVTGATPCVQRCPLDLACPAPRHSSPLTCQFFLITSTTSVT